MEAAAVGAPECQAVSVAKTTTERGYGADWQKLRNYYIRHNPVCQIQKHCLGDAAKEVDHVTPFQGKDDPLRLDRNNLQSACKPCHDWKTKHVDNDASTWFISEEEKQRRRFVSKMQGKWVGSVGMNLIANSLKKNL